MPLYAYSCDRCGLFEVRRSVSEVRARARCPACGAVGTRVFTAPLLARLDRPLRSALDREEASGHEPEVTSAKRGRPLPHVHEQSPPWVLSH
jgi:putative FmdB family regulatory protein